MNLTVIKKDEITALQRRSQHCFDKVNPGFAIDCAFDTQRGAQSRQADGTNGREVITRDFIALSTQGELSYAGVRQAALDAHGLEHRRAVGPLGRSR